MRLKKRWALDEFWLQTCARPPPPSLPMCLPNLFACSVLGCKEAYIVSGLMSYARAYWRKATKKNTGGDVPCLNIHTYMCHAQLFHWYRLFLSTNMRARPITTLGCKQIESCHARKSPPRSTLLPEKNNWWFGCRGSCKWTSWWGWNLFSTVCWRFGHAALFFNCLLNLVSHTGPGPWSQASLMSSMKASHGLQRSSPPWRRRHQSTLLHGWCSFVHDFWNATRIELPEGTQTQWCIYIQLRSVAHNYIQLYRQLMIHKNILEYERPIKCSRVPGRHRNGNIGWTCRSRSLWMMMTTVIQKARFRIWGCVDWVILQSIWCNTDQR